LLVTATVAAGKLTTLCDDSEGARDWLNAMSLAKPKGAAVVPLGANEDVSAVVIENDTFLSKWASLSARHESERGGRTAGSVKSLPAVMSS
jgi:hypothetical protein